MSHIGFHCGLIKCLLWSGESKLSLEIHLMSLSFICKMVIIRHSSRMLGRLNIIMHVRKLRRLLNQLNRITI